MPLFLMAWIVSLAVAAPAVAERPFAPRFSQNVGGGGIAIAANTLMTCPAADADCAAAQAGTASGAALNNNAYPMRNVDVDGDPSTFSSSRAVLALPPGAEVLFAGLYFGARTSSGGGSGAGPAPDPAARGLVRLQVPGGGYAPVAAAVDDSTAVTGAYQGFADVTGTVATAGAGTYGVADVQAGTGVDRYAGWSLVVAYRTTTGPPRNLSVFDGLASVSSGAPAVTIPISGFETPESGPVRTQAGVVAYEGDRNAGGDRVLLDGAPLSDAANLPTNFFNSTISVDGTGVLSGDPAYANQLGFDAVLTRADGFLGNGATNATIQALTTQEQYVLGAVTFSTELNPAVLTRAEVEIESAPGDDAIGSELKQRAVIDNTGPVPIEGAALTTRYDAPVAVIDADGARCDGDKRIRCEVGPLEPGERERIDLVVRPLEQGRLRTESVLVDSAGDDLGTDATVTRVDRGEAEVRLRQRASRERLEAGGRVTFTIDVRARGEVAVVDGRVCDRVPEALRVIRARDAERDRARVCWSFAQLLPGERLRFRLLARAAGVSSPRTVTNPAELTAANVRGEREAEVVRVRPDEQQGVAEDPPPAAACRASAPARRC